MRCMVRNKQVFYHASYMDKREIVDEYGNATGQYEVIYSDPVQASGNISAAQGEMESRQFGDSETYDKVIVLDNPKSNIDEYSILWVDTTPNKSPSHDYIVKKIARSLNSVAIAISKVNVG